MATIPPNSMQAAQSCRQLHQRQLQQKQCHLLRAVSAPASSADPSPNATPESTPPPSPRKFESLMGINPLSKLHAMLHRSLPCEVDQPALATNPLAAHMKPPTTVAQSTVPQVTEVGASASGLTQSLEASHHTSSITSMT